MKLKDGVRRDDRHCPETKYEVVCMKTDRCDWCRMEYPRGGWDCYYELDVMGKNNEMIHHVICSDCYDRLKPVPGTRGN